MKRIYLMLIISLLSILAEDSTAFEERELENRYIETLSLSPILAIEELSL